MPTGTARRPVALFVLGMPRSGTSALTRVLSLCGGALPGQLELADSFNPRGYWEPRETHHLNGRMLRRHYSTDADPSLRLQEEGALDVEEKTAFIEEVKAFLTTLPYSSLVVIKDLYITALSEMWFDAARQTGFDIAAVIALRHPQEVIASVAASRRVSPELPNALPSAMWLKYNLLAERNTRGMPRVFVEYANLLQDWRREVKRISAALKINLANRDECAVDNFLTKNLHRNRAYGPVAEPFGTDWVSTVYEVTQSAARDEPWKESALDRVYDAYRASEHAFRTAFNDFSEDFRDHMPPPNAVLLRLLPRRNVIIELRRRRGVRGVSVEVRRRGSVR
ncbi:sulfotransferase [Mycobacterium mantenii]|nr:sulfotransferase [Mycobacterium mantenii]MCV7242909.1 sulfotransferase [Mycobacterium mantenii]ORB01922.1 sulfotransferase family protein [Mycobacterium mantenii]